ncbi:hypothetical protein [Candidatus Magnetomonas plexicatena]|uniref:hypothetical protein n=1 Tax=Candidatus Magnetomonas plexicatena TaxID=2552947 RepID=UPI001C7641EE|nr:hypothetical protein E2O03_007405 [Nitrospirales bacterium LBB_01]
MANKAIDRQILDNDGGLLNSKLLNVDDDTYWIEKAVEAEKGGYAGHEKTIEFLLEKLV